MPIPGRSICRPASDRWADRESPDKALNMSIENVDTVVVGAGQAGLAISDHLSHRGVQHVVLERDRIAESWRSRRWD